MKKEYVFEFKGNTPKARFEEFVAIDGILEEIANQALILKNKDENAPIPFPVLVWFQYGKLMKAAHVLLCVEDGNLGTHLETFIAVAVSDGKFGLKDKLLALQKEILEGVALYENFKKLGVTDEDALDENLPQQLEIISNTYDYVYMRNRARTFDACVTSIVGSTVV